ncbi:NAD-dependent epimerase/dehydratase family protein [Geopsychrobacter electrodiphilus]|uniref:NAD-dependent epimerase/dehydratase family protein n=1 Tax=Geopsychrobacter electrodiphilus TaxID=225196 RepID=UPI000382C58C|nr:NAD-dependent epimerase/dehydratase family protein [Geopsychrobacter electrodiphilus]
MRVLVLGGNGFIGSHLVDELLRRGDRVRVFDRFDNNKNAKKNNIDCRLGDFSDTSALAEALHDIDVVYHLISTTVPSTSNLDPVADIQGNLIATVQLLQQMVCLNVKRIVFLSSGGTVYGNPSLVPVPETHPLNPICSYGIVKVAIEKYLNMFAELHGIKPLILRASNPYGPRQGHIGVQGVIPTFLKRLVDGDSFHIWGDGSIVRDYIFIHDLVKLCLLAGDSGAVGAFNAGSGLGYSLLNIISAITEVSGRIPQVEYFTERKFDVKRVVLDMKKARDVFGWTPETSIEDGILSHWEWLLSVSEQ